MRGDIGWVVLCRSSSMRGGIYSKKTQDDALLFWAEAPRLTRSPSSPDGRQRSLRAVTSVRLSNASIKIVTFRIWWKGLHHPNRHTRHGFKPCQHKPAIDPAVENLAINSVAPRLLGTRVCKSSLDFSSTRGDPGACFAQGACFAPGA